MPQVHLIGLVNLLLNNIAPAIQTGMGLIPLSWHEIDSFVRVNDFKLNPFELRVIKNASKAYVSQSTLATDPKCPPPHRMIKRDPIKLAEHIKNVFS